MLRDFEIFSIFPLLNGAAKVQTKDVPAKKMIVICKMSLGWEYRVKWPKKRFETLFFSQSKANPWLNKMIIQKFDTVKDPEMSDEEAEYQMNKYVSNWEHSDDHLETEW